MRIVSQEKIFLFFTLFSIIPSFLALKNTYAEYPQSNKDKSAYNRQQAIRMEQEMIGLAKRKHQQSAYLPPKTGASKLSSLLGFNEKLFGLHGYLETRSYYHTHKNNNYYYFYELRNNFRLFKEFNLSKNLHAFTSLEGSVFFFDNRDSGFKQEQTRLNPWENYLDYYAEKFDARIGRQLIRWGKSDEVNPTDVFTPEDLSEFFNDVERAKRKIPSFAAKFNYFFNNDYSLEIIWLPFFEKTRLDGDRGNWEPYLYRYYRSLGFEFPNDDGPSKKIGHSSAAIKLKREGENWDSSLSYSRHYAEIPALELNPLLGQVNSTFPRQHTIGADFETIFGKLGLRGEGAFTTTRPFLSYDPNVTTSIVYKDAFDYVLGADYTFPSGFYTNLQYARQFILDYPEDLSTQEIEDSLIWRMSQNFRHDTITLKTTGRYYLSTKDLLFESSFIYKITDAMTFILGYYLFEGKETGTFGQFKKNDQVFTRLKYSF